MLAGITGVDYSPWLDVGVGYCLEEGRVVAKHVDVAPLETGTEPQRRVTFDDAPQQQVGGLEPEETAPEFRGVRLGGNAAMRHGVAREPLYLSKSFGERRVRNLST